MKEKCKECKDRPTQLEWLDSLVEKAKSYAIVLIVFVIVIGILMIFWCTLTHPEMPGLTEMNQFVSIVLGIVATIVSIVSMLISFYGLEKTEESERRQHEILEKIMEFEERNLQSTRTIEQNIQTTLQYPRVISREVESLQNGASNDLDNE